MRRNREELQPLLGSDGEDEPPFACNFPQNLPRAVTLPDIEPHPDYMVLNELTGPHVYILTLRKLYGFMELGWPDRTPLPAAVHNSKNPWHFLKPKRPENMTAEEREEAMLPPKQNRLRAK